MTDDKTLLKLKDIKIKLLEQFINESARLADLYEWAALPEDMELLNSLSIQLSDIDEYIKDMINVKKEGLNTS
jgi:hypothetical protein